MRAKMVKNQARVKGYFVIPEFKRSAAIAGSVMPSTLRIERAPRECNRDQTGGV